MSIRKSIIVVLILVSNHVLGQGQGSTPYSTFGVGEVQSETTASQDMMGGAGVSFTNSFYINHINPALIVKNRTIGFNKYVAFNIGLKGAYRVLSQNGKIQPNFGMNLTNISFLFPIKPKWAMGLSLKPYSITEHTSVITKPFSGTSVNNITENKSYGGISRVSFTNGLQVAKWLYWGAEGQYSFGVINRDSTNTLSGSSEYFRVSNRTDLKGYSFKTGLSATLKLNEKWNLNIGSIYQLGSSLKGEQIRLFSVLADQGNGPTYIQAPDTLGIRSVSTDLPSTFKVGLSLESPYHWVLAADYGKTTWTGLKHFDSKLNTFYKNSTELNVGLEWIPNVKSGKYFDQIFYRAGYREVLMPYVIQNVQSKDRSVSLGLSLPLGFRSPSYIDLAVAIGRRGNTSLGQIQENYTRISVNFSLLSSWFNKPRIE